MSKQKTLKGSFSLCGKGLHTGLSLTVTFNPAAENTGYKIQRIDLEDQPVIQAVAENVVETQRGTVLGKGDVRVSTIEHGMSALYALGIDNCLIQVNAFRIPYSRWFSCFVRRKDSERGHTGAECRERLLYHPS